MTILDALAVFVLAPAILVLLAVAIVKLAKTRKRSREMSCPTCCTGRECIEQRSWMCTTCHDTFQTPKQFDASLAAERKVKGRKP